MTFDHRPRVSRLIALAALLCLPVAGCAMITDETRIANASLAPQKAPAGPAVALVSAHRRAHGLPPLTHDARLQALAEQQALAMARADRLSHTTAGSLGARLAGTPHQAASENISAGYDTLPRAVESWKRSPEHNKNLLSPPLRRMGIAAANAPGSRYGVYWAIVMTD